MKIQALQIELIEWLSSLKDESMLMQLKSVKDSVLKNDWSLDLTEVQKKKIEQGLVDMKNGNMIDSKVLWTKYDEKI